jgi:dTDP-glucose pyrophosphorylase
MKIVVPMAGRGTRFAVTGVTTPKPLIDVNGQPMVYWALKSIDNIDYSQLIFIILQEHDTEYKLGKWLKERFGAQVVKLPQVTEGQLCTVLAARNFIDSDEDVLIISSDTYIISDIRQNIRTREPDCTGIISVADMPGDRWSFARVDERGHVVEVAEKMRISNHASTGMYYFANGHQLVVVGDEMILRQEKMRGEYYVIPVYQKYIECGWKVTLSLSTEMWDMGTPDALVAFKAYLNEQGQR